MALPRFAVIKANYNDKYLRYIHEDVQAHGYLQFSGEEVVSPYAKYELEMAKSGKGLVHIRCCYNNKYWVRKAQNDNWIVGEAAEPEEDQSKWSCTLFEPLYVSDGDVKTLRFRHVQLNNYACSWRNGTSTDACLYAATDKVDWQQSDVYTIINWESLLILPKHIAFKGDNGSYLSARWIDGYQYLQFASNDKGDASVGNEVFTTSDGSIRIKSDYFGKFWRLSPNWIWADSSDTTSNNKDTLFRPTKVDNNVVALRNLGNNNFCKILTADGKISCLNAAASTISKETKLQVEELVISRNIYNVNFRLMDSRIYDQNVIVMATQDVTNTTSQPNSVDMKFTYTDTTSSTWNTSVSLKLEVKTNIKAGIPRIADGKIEITTEVSTQRQWGKSVTQSQALETVHHVVVPPMTRVKVNLLATKGSCDVPFSYTQSETLTNGQQITNNMDDGIYSGINCFNFKIDTKETKL